MKNFMTFIVAFALIFSLAGCSKTEQHELVVYSFSGEDDFLSVSNGVIVLNDENEIFYGGDLTVKGDESTNIAEYTSTIYLVDGKRILMSNSVEDKTGETINVPSDIGKVSGDILRDNDIEKLADNLWFELKTIDLNGKENTYQLQLELTKITGNN